MLQKNKDFFNSLIKLQQIIIQSKGRISWLKTLESGLDAVIIIQIYGLKNRSGNWQPSKQRRH